MRIVGSSVPRLLTARPGLFIEEDEFARLPVVRMNTGSPDQVLHERALHGDGPVRPGHGNVRGQVLIQTCRDDSEHDSATSAWAPSGTTFSAIIRILADFGGSHCIFDGYVIDVAA